MKRFIIILVLLCSCRNEANQIVKNDFEVSERGLEFIRDREGFTDYAINDGARWTIGYGNTYYENQEAVRKGDRITRKRAAKLFDNIVQEFAGGVNEAVTSKINQSQFDALVSYSYNRGLGSLRKSTLLKMVNREPNNPNIFQQFIIEWGSYTKYKHGLQKRRKMEAEMYFNNEAASKEESKFWQYLQLGLLLIVVSFRKEIIDFITQWKISVSKK